MLGIFTPVLMNSSEVQEQTKLTSGALNKFNPADYDVQLNVNQSLLDVCGLSVDVSRPDSLLQIFDPSTGSYIPGVHHINSSSVASVVGTDIYTVEQVIKEISA